MKKFFLVMIMMILMVPCVYAEDTVIVTIPEYDVTVNGKVLDVASSQYPVIRYQGVTYFPMTSDYLEGIGLTLDWHQDTGLSINQSPYVGVLNQAFLRGSNTLGSQHTAKLVTFDVHVNGQKIDNTKEAYPLLLFNDITYFPMTWRFAVTEFGWQTNWDATNGFEILVHKNDVEKNMISEEKLDYKEASDYSARSNPIRINEVFEYTENNLFECVDLEISLNEIIRGEEAYDLLIKESSLNDEAEKGYEYLLAAFTVKYLDNTEKEKEFFLNSENFDLYHENGTKYPQASIFLSDSRLSKNLSIGTSNHGYVGFAVRKTDTNPLIVYDMHYTGAGGIWFQGYSGNYKDISDLNVQPIARKPYMDKEDFGTKNNPVKIGDEIDHLKINSNDLNPEFRFSISEIIRGQKANEMVDKADFNTPDPIEGYEYFLAKVNVACVGATDESKSYGISYADFTLVNEKGIPYPEEYITAPDPQLFSSMFVGGETVGYIPYLIRKDDLKPRIVYGHPKDDKSSVWFDGHE